MCVFAAPVLMVCVRSSVRMGMMKCAMAMQVTFDKFICGQGHRSRLDTRSGQRLINVSALSLSKSLTVAGRPASRNASSSPSRKTCCTWRLRSGRDFRLL